MFVDVLSSAGLVLLGSTVAFPAVSARTIDESKFKPADIIVRDVAVVGGGAAGAYAAVRIKDSSKTVVVIDQAGHLGGHVDTYAVPGANILIDFGVQAYLDLPGAKDFFNRFGIATEAASAPPFASQYINFLTGKPAPGYPAFDAAAQGMALGAYAQIAAQYTPLLFPGFFNLPNPLPADLAMNFGDFIAAHQLEAAVPIIWKFCYSLGDILKTPTFHVMQNFHAVHVQAISTPGGFFIPSSHNNSQLYAAVQASLGADVLLGSKVSVSDRQPGGVKLVVKDAAGKEKLVKAKRLLVTIPPTKSNMYPFDLDTVEQTVFGKWTWQDLFTGIFSHSNLPDGLQIINTTPDFSAGALNLPKLPFAFAHTFTGVQGLYQTSVVGDPSLNEHQAKILVRDSVAAMGTAGTFATKRIDFEAFSDHSPNNMRPSPADLNSGFYGSLYALQGLRNTFYSGAAWTTDYSPIIWIFTETILPRLLAGL